ncbi:phenylalanine--tRNA ligase subunit beta [Jonesia quinghaiensis]|uniref:phenylalanine--tRNA ligase subunit beta n=1 Tax=Jonesia quinghaiensis TaxID=262806 RepID=UPI000429E610|nr:phenylalanine--tRNA ligase subunit beta [Jonesia quinghaiensis]
MPRISLPWLADHVDLPQGLTAEQLAADLVRVGLEEEAIHSAGVTGPLVVGRVVSLVKEPQKNGKVINWCQVDVGDHGVAREDGGFDPRGIICGAHNFEEGDFIVAALPGAVLPGPFPIASRKTYGHISDGMICSQRELGLGEDHDGIMVLTRMGFSADELVPGSDALTLLGLHEEVLEINVTPDRGYCFSMRGIAREYAHSTGAVFTDQGVGEHLPPATDDGFAVTVADDAPIHGNVGCDRFVTRIVRGIDATRQTPRWMARRLEQAGMRPISLTVDVTNYVMLDLGQPLHAYDLSTLVEPVVVRRARPGESLTTLDSVRRELATEDLLITDSQGGQGARILGLAGVMGGAETEVSVSTSDVLIEAAHFDPVSVARTARRHKLPSEAAKRFERGVDPQLPAVAAQRVVDLLVEFGGGVADSRVSDVMTLPPMPVIKFSLRDPERLCGVAYSDEQVVAVLREIGCVVTAVAESLIVDVVPPSWRPDLTGAAELVEEVARLVGYDAIPATLPAAPAGRGLTAAQRTRRSVARALAEYGFVETLSYPFTSEAIRDDLMLPADDQRRASVRLRNPLQGDRGVMRTSLLETLVETARRNVSRGMVNIALSETGLVTLPSREIVDAPQLPPARTPEPEELQALLSAVPHQPRHVAGVMCGFQTEPGWWGPAQQWQWSDALDAAALVAERAGVDVRLQADTARAPFHPGRCAAVVTTDGVVVGHAGELHPQVCERLGLPARSCAFEVDLDALLSIRDGAPVQAHPVSTFPLAKEDLALVVDESVTVALVVDAVRRGGGDAVESVQLFDVYRGEQIGEGRKSLAVALRLRASDRTLTAQDTAAIRDAILAEAAERVGAELRG